jgi:hypothetical protein
VVLTYLLTDDADDGRQEVLGVVGDGPVVERLRGDEAAMRELVAQLTMAITAPTCVEDLNYQVCFGEQGSHAHA